MCKIQILLSVTLFQALKFIFLVINNRQCPNKKWNAMNIPAVLTDKLRIHLKFLLSGGKKLNGSCCKRKHDPAWFCTTEEKIKL